MSNKTDYKTFYNGFREISKLMHTSRSLREVQQRTVWKATELLNAKGALLRILNPETEQFEVAAAYGVGEWYLKKGPVSTKKPVRPEGNRPGGGDRGHLTRSARSISKRSLG
jgi:hypothetical protein